MKLKVRFLSFLGGELVLWLLILLLGVLLDLLWLLLIEFHELGEIELGLLEELDLLHDDVLKGEDLLALSEDSLADALGDTIKDIINI